MQPVSTPTHANAPDDGRKRNRRAWLTTVTNLGAKVITVLTSFATIPLTLHHLGSERFGLWMTISSFTALLAFADLGLGNGVLNVIAQASGRSDQAAIRRAIASAAVMLSTVSLVLALLLGPLVMLIDWSRAFDLRDPRSQAEVVPALLTFGTCLLLNIVVALSGRIQMALQQGFFTGLINAAGAIAGLIGVLAAIHAEAGLPWLILALVGAPLLTNVVGAIVFFRRGHADLIPTRADIQPQVMSQLARVGALFFVLQLASAFAYSSDNTIAAHYLGADSVGTYAIVSKLFGAIGIVTGMLLQPLWPAYGEALARGDHTWVKTTLRRSMMISTGFAAAASLVLFFGFDLITSLWLHTQVQAPATLLLGFCAWAITDALGNSFAMYLNGAHVVRFQVVVALLNAAVSFGVKVWSVQGGHLNYLPWVTTGSYIVCALIPYLVFVPRHLQRQP